MVLARLDRADAQEERARQIKPGRQCRQVGPGGLTPSGGDHGGRHPAKAAEMRLGLAAGIPGAEDHQIGPARHRLHLARKDLRNAGPGELGMVERDRVMHQNLNLRRNRPVQGGEQPRPTGSRVRCSDRPARAAGAAAASRPATARGARASATRRTSASARARSGCPRRVRRDTRSAGPGGTRSGHRDASTARAPAGSSSTKPSAVRTSAKHGTGSASRRAQIGQFDPVHPGQRPPPQTRHQPRQVQQPRRRQATSPVTARPSAAPSCRADIPRTRRAVPSRARPKATVACRKPAFEPQS